MKNLLLLIALASSFCFAQKLDMTVFNQMKARQIGPAGMSGRVTCIDVVASQPDIIYIGTASGGVWKSTNGGASWESIADTLPTINIGAIAIQQSNPDVIWVGTGEGNPRNSQNSGYGVYRSLDAGRTWELMGLEQSRNIHRLIIHPDDPNTVWVGAQGPQWGDNSNRGVYKTTDGGENWKLVLEGDSDLGIGDLVIDPNNPNKLIAAMWQFRRNPWNFTSGGPKSGLFISVDGGENWTEIGELEGLPKKPYGRMGLAIAPSNSKRVYALVEAEVNAVYRSDDGGYKWTKVSEDKNSGNRPFYYSDIFVDPQNENRVYSLWSRVSKSEDGGKNWDIFLPYRAVHPDHHALWIHPNDPSYIILGNDGGLNISRDRGMSWKFIESLPLAQYYHINVDNEIPYNIYGGMQDNGSWRGPGYSWRSGPIRNSDFVFLYGGDGFDVSADPDQPNRYGYAMYQRGYLVRYDLESGFKESIRPTSADQRLRFNWNAAFAQDPNDNSTIYYGSQYLHRSKNKGDSWEIISPDLTTNDTSKQHQVESGGLTIDATGAENFTTIVSIAPSPKDSKVIWVGSDDGRLHLTTDGGENWTSLEKKLPGMPEGAWIPQIQASKQDVNEVFVVVNDYRRNNWKPYLYHSKDQGKSWTRIADETDFSGYCLSVVQDPKEPNLVFVGTENGLYVSVDRGENWNHWNHGFPNVSTMDLAIQEREGDLVIGTFGRAAYVLDNLDPLRQLAAENETKWTEKQLHLFAIPDAYLVSSPPPAGRNFAGKDVFSGENRPYGARIYVHYELMDTSKVKSKKAKVKIKSESGEVIRNLEPKLEDGVNYLVWNLSGKRPRYASSAKKRKPREAGGRPIVPGKYSIEISIDQKTVKGSFEVKADPRLKVGKEGYLLRQERYDAAMNLMKDVTALCDQLRDCLTSIEKVKKLLPTEKSTAKTDVEKLNKELTKKVQGMLDGILGKKDQKGIVREQYILMDRMWKLIASATASLTGGEQAFQNNLKIALKMYQEERTAVNAFLSAEWQQYKTKVKALNLDPFKL